MSHSHLQAPRYFRLLVRIDEELAADAQAVGCACGGVLHVANYPRKPRGCPSEVRGALESRFSFCCNRCRRRTTSMSVRFLGRRVYLALAMVLASARHAGRMPAAAPVGGVLGVPRRTLERWRVWWSEQFVLTPLWRASGARFMPPVAIGVLPASLLERFAGDAAAAMTRMLIFLAPITLGVIR